jgi:hypothetical protein
MARMEEDVVFSNLRDKLFTAVVGDVLDKMGWRRQFLPQAIGPLKPDMKFVGRAMPVLEADIFDEPSGAPGAGDSKPFGLMLEALDDLRPNEVYVATGAPRAQSSMASFAMPRGSRPLAFRPSAADYTRKIRGRAAK